MSINRFTRKEGFTILGALGMVTVIAAVATFIPSLKKKVDQRVQVVRVKSMMTRLEEKIQDLFAQNTTYSVCLSSDPANGEVCEPDPGIISQVEEDGGSYEVPVIFGECAKVGVVCKVVADETTDPIEVTSAFQEPIDSDTYLYFKINFTHNGGASMKVGPPIKPKFLKIQKMVATGNVAVTCTDPTKPFLTYVAGAETKCVGMEDDRFTCDPGEVMVGFDLEKRQIQCKSLSDQLISCNNPSSEFIGRLEFDFDPESGGNIVSVDRDRCVARLNPYDLMERPDEPECDFAGGTGSSGDPYLIKDVYDLQCMHISPTAHYRLSNDIDASVTSTWNSSWWTNEAQDTFTFSITSSMRGGDGFFPIRVFSGSFDGAGFRISNLDIDRTMNDVALFGEASGAVIKNVELKDFDVRNGGGNYRLNTAFLIGDDRSGSSISDVVVDGGTIEGADEVGALAGEGKDTTFSNVEVTGVDITCDDECGGVVGDLEDYNEEVEIDTAIVQNVSIDCDDNCGGVVGHIDMDSTSDSVLLTNIEVINTSVTGYADQSTANIGGIAGVGGGVLSNSSLDASTIARGENRVGGVIGVNSAYGMTITQVHSAASSICATTSSGDESVCGGFFGEIVHMQSGVNLTVSICSATGNVTGSTASSDIESISGGFAGRVEERTSGTSPGLSVDQCQASGTVAGYTAGGFIGEIDHGSSALNQIAPQISNSFSHGQATGYANVGGFIGILDDTDLSLVNIYTSSPLSLLGSGHMGTFIGRSYQDSTYSTTISNSFSTSNSDSQKSVSTYSNNTFTMTNSFHLYPADALGVQEENGGTSAFYTQAHSIYDEANDTTDNWTNRLIWDHRAGSLPDLLPIVLYQEGE